VIDSSNRIKILNSAGTLVTQIIVSSNFVDLDIRPGTTTKVIHTGVASKGYFTFINSGNTTGFSKFTPNLTANLAAACYSRNGEMYAVGGGGGASNTNVYILNDTTDTSFYSDSISTLGLKSCTFSHDG